MVVFESSSAILTTTRCIQTFRVAGSSWKDARGGLQFMIFEQGTVIALGESEPIANEIHFIQVYYISG